MALRSKHLVEFMKDRERDTLRQAQLEQMRVIFKIINHYRQKI